MVNSRSDEQPAEFGRAAGAVVLVQPRVVAMTITAGFGNDELRAKRPRLLPKQASRLDSSSGDFVPVSPSEYQVASRGWRVWRAGIKNVVLSRQL